MTDLAKASFAVLSLGLGLACGPADSIEVPFTVRFAPEQDVRSEASLLQVTVEQLGPEQFTVAQSWPGSFSPATSELFLFTEHPFGDAFRFRVEAVTFSTELGYDAVLARGFSMPFSVSPGGQPDGLWPRGDQGPRLVRVGAVGRFQPISGMNLDGPVLAVSRTRAGALIATGPGTVYEYHVQADGDVVPELLLSGTAPQGSGATFAAVPSLGLLSLGGTLGGASVLAPEPSAALDDSSGLPVYGAGVAVDSERGRAWLVGGSSTPDGPAADTITRIDVGGGAITAVTEPARLPWPLMDAEVLAVPVLGRSSSLETRLLVVGGRTDAQLRTEVVLMDPSGAEAPAILDLGTARDDAALAVLEPNLCFMAGGRQADGRVTSRITVLAVQPGSVEPVSPQPSGGRMLAPRAGAAAIPIVSGLVLIAGGTDAEGMPLSSVELVDMRVFPGEVVPTGPLPFAAAAPRGVLLWNDAVLVAGELGLAEYTIPSVEVVGL